MPREFRILILTPFKNFICFSLPGLLLVLVLLEMFFRYVIPSAEIPYVYYDPAAEILRYDTNSRRDGTFTMGPSAREQARWRINNDGWNSPIDYVPQQDRKKPLIAVIGDSMIEALQVNADKSATAVLRRLIGEDYEVYSFGMSGAPLSQYLQMTKYVDRHFKPEVVVFNLIHNDFDESIRDLVNMPHFLQLRRDNGMWVEVPPRPYKASLVKRLYRQSYLLRYLLLNLQARRLWEGLTRKPSAATDEKTIQTIREAIFFLTEKIMEVNAGREVIFMMEPPRKDIYSGNLQNGASFRLRKMVEEACLRHQCRFVDLTRPFWKKFAVSGVKFTYDYDGHWNEIGHDNAARALYASLIEFGIVSP